MNPDTVYPAAFAPRKDQTHWSPGTVTWGEILDWLDEPRKRKDVDGYILATLESRSKLHTGAKAECSGGFHRDSRSVVRRSAMVVLDIDTPDTGFELKVELLLAGHAYVLHTTYSSTPSEPRYRLLVPVDRDMAPDEYVEAARSLAQRFGEEQVDPGSFQHTRFMYKPSARKPEWFDFFIGEGDPMVVDDLLDSFVDDLSASAPPRPGRTKRDPFGIEGPVGAFNRAYEDWDELIDVFDLPYEKETDGRWHLRGARSFGGLTTMPVAGFLYSNHAHDPAFGQACSAFDLVRLHRFGELDADAKPGTPINKMPSYLAMLDFATQDHRVRDALFDMAVTDFNTPLEDQADDAEADPDDDWKVRYLNPMRSGKLSGQDLGNWDALRRFDPVFRRLRFNDMTLAVEFEPGELPWRTVTDDTRAIDRSDRTEFHDYLMRNYRFDVIPRELLNDRIDAKARKQRYYPVRDYLDSLTWDGTPRLEECLPGVRPTEYARWVARKCLVAAVARVYEPGCFWDHTLVLYGDEGVGKSKWISRMGRGWAATLPPKLDSTDTLRTVHRSWIIVSEEGHTIKRADFEMLKDFLTRTEDSFRLPYEKDFYDGKRRCVIWSTTNDETFLRKEVGNRRFLVVHCETPVDFEALTDDYVDQVWAEAVSIYRRADEPLYLSPDQSIAAALERERFTEEDVLAGIVQEYVSRPVPADWELRSRDERQRWMYSEREFESGTERMDRVTSVEILELALGKRIGDERPGELTRITNALKRLQGWVPEGLSSNSGGYGPQLVFIRKESLL